MIFQILLLLTPFTLAKEKCNLLKKLLDCKDVNKILNFHNEIRQQVASGETSLKQAKDMWVLKWSKKLASEAQAWANECKYSKNEDKLYSYGENLAEYTGHKKTEVDIERLTQIWYNELQNYDPDAAIDLYNTGRFTQIIWANTKFVGCGISEFKDERNELSPYKTMLVCNYQPPGNYPDQKPYQVFEWIRCERGIPSEEYQGLCAHDYEQSRGNYVPCSGYMLQPTPFFFVVFLLYSYYQYHF